MGRKVSYKDWGAIDKVLAGAAKARKQREAAAGLSKMADEVKHMEPEPMHPHDGSMKQAKSQLEKETERGEHRPAVGGYADHKHGGES